MKSYLIFCKSIIFLISFWWSPATYAQKLPESQTNGRWLPSTVKIDGRFTEWNGVLAAHNRQSQINYLIANDDKNLYLAVSATDQITMGKIVAGGISFSIDDPDRDKTEGGPMITFPVGNTREAANNRKYLDTALLKLSALQVKEIKVKGFKGITDSLLFVGNEFGIRGRVLYRDKCLFYEMLVPLEFFGLSGSNAVELNYTLRLNGQPFLVKMGDGPDAPVKLWPIGNYSAAGSLPGSPISNAMQLMISSSFSGKYKLAVNP